MTKRLNIAITKTRLTGFSITMPKDDEAGMPNAAISMDLMTEYGYTVTSVNYNNSYNWKEQSFDLPARAYDLINELASIMHTIGEQKVQNVTALLDAPKEPSPEINV